MNASNSSFKAIPVNFNHPNVQNVINSKDMDVLPDSEARKFFSLEKKDVNDIFYGENPLGSVESNCRFYLSEVRKLDYQTSLIAGICSFEDWLVFVYMRDSQIVRWKGRHVRNKKWIRTSPLPEGGKEIMPFFNQFKGLTSDEVIVVEGEFDVVSLIQLPNFDSKKVDVISLPHGAQSVTSCFKNNYEFLQQYKKIYIAFDNDEAGNKAAQDAASLIPISKYRRIIFPGAKDANEWIMEHPENRPDLEFKDLQLLMKNSTRIETPCITDFEDFPESFYDEVDVGCSSGWSELDDIVGGFRLGEVVVVTADTGSGKTTFCNNLIMNFLNHDKGVWINSFEMDPSQVNRMIAGAVLQKNMKTAKFTQDDRENFKKYMKGKNYKLNIDNIGLNISILGPQIEKASLIFNCKYILLDHLDYIYNSGEKSSAHENIEQVMRGLHSIAIKCKVCIILVAHIKQSEKGREKEAPTINSLKGSASIKQYADSIIILKREEDSDITTISVGKNRLFGRLGSFKLIYNAMNHTFESLNIGNVLDEFINHRQKYITPPAGVIPFFENDKFESK